MVASWDFGTMRTVTDADTVEWARIMADTARALKKKLGPRTTLLVREVIPITPFVVKRDGEEPASMLPRLLLANKELRRRLRSTDVHDPVLLPAMDWQVGPEKFLHRQPCAFADHHGNHLELFTPRMFVLSQILNAYQMTRRAC